MNCINPRFQMISCIGLEMVKTYFKLFLGKIHSKCLAYSGEFQIYESHKYNILASERELNCVRNRSSVHLEKKDMLVLTYIP